MCHSSALHGSLDQQQYSSHTHMACQVVDRYTLRPIHAQAESTGVISSRDSLWLEEHYTLNHMKPGCQITARNVAQPLRHMMPTG
jgi:hypothetical protein